MSRSSPDDIWQLWNFKQMQKLSWHNLSLKTVVVHNSVTSVMMKTNLQKGGLVHRVPYAKSREKLQEFFQSVYVLFCNINTITYFNLFVCPLKQRDMSVMTRVSNFILWFYLNFLLLLFISTLCVVHNLIFQRKGAFWSPLFTLLVTQARKCHVDRSRLHNVLGQLGIYSPFGCYENLKSST